MERIIGKAEYERHLRGKQLTMEQAIWAKCYRCMKLIEIEASDCAMRSCQLYPYMPYNPSNLEEIQNR